LITTQPSVKLSEQAAMITPRKWNNVYVRQSRYDRGSRLPVEADDHFDDHRVSSDDVCHWSRHTATHQADNAYTSV